MTTVDLLTLIGYCRLLCTVAMAGSVFRRPAHDVTAPSGGFVRLPYVCVDGAPFAVIFVHSAPDHGRHRTAIRDSWGAVSRSPELNTRVVFVLGVPTADSSVTSADVDREIAEHGDILQVSVTDVYSNLTIKSVAMLNWVRLRCAGAKYVIKADDDTFLNSPMLIRDLEKVVHSRFMMGDIIAGARPIRDRDSKYFTPTSVFNDSMYPTYLSGAAYVISGDLVPALTDAAGSVSEPFWLEDVFITGLLARKIDAKLVYNGKFSFRTTELRPCQLRKLLALHRLSPAEMTNAWALLLKENAHC